MGCGVGCGGGRRGRRLLRRRRARVLLGAAGGGLLLESCGLPARLGGEPGLAAALFRLEHGDLLADRVVERLALGEARLDLLPAGGPLRDDLLLPGEGALERRALPLDLGLRPADVLEDAGVVLGDAVRGVEAVQEVVEARRSENDLHHVDLAALVEGDQALLDGPLRAAEARAGDVEPVLVGRELALELLQTDVGAVPLVHGELEVEVELVDLGEHLLGLRPLLVDAVRVGRDRPRKGERCDQGEGERREACGGRHRLSVARLRASAEP